MVLDAHNRAFIFFGGVPLRMVYDNLKTVVDTVFVGKERKFKALCEIHWVIKFHFSTEKINHVDKVMDIAVTPGASFG